MRSFFLTLLVVAAALHAPASGNADDAVLADEPVPAGTVTEPAPAAGVADPVATSPPPMVEASPPAVSADGTTSVVVPAAEPEVSTPPPFAVPPAAPTDPLANSALGPAATAPSSVPMAAPPVMQQPPPPVVTSSDAAAVLASLLDPMAGPPGSPPPPAYARPLPLLEAIVRSGDRSRRLWIVQAYWKVALCFADVRCATAAAERLELVAPGGDPHDRATLDVAAAAARADLADANARLGVAQQELVDLARLAFGEPPPWPIDRPLADPYQTRFEEIFANRIATGRVRAIVRTLPARHEAVAARATAVTAADRAMQMAEADHAKGNRPIEAVIAAHQTLVDQQAAFLEAVRSYNVEIAEYAMAVADLSLPDEAFVSMLIASPTPWQPQSIEAVGALPPGAASLPPSMIQPPSDYLPPPATVIRVE
jgi:hypothetical protein